MDTMMKARSLVAQEDRQARESRVARKAVELQREQTLAKANEARQRRDAAAALRVSEFMVYAPRAVLTYGPIKVTVTYRGRDAQEVLVIGEAVRRCERILHAAFTRQVGLVRNGTSGGELFDERIVATLQDELRHAVRLGAVHIEIAQ